MVSARGCAVEKSLVVKVEKWIIWGGFLAIIYLLRHLFPVLFFTFILSYIGNTILCYFTRRTAFRRTILILLYVVLVSALLGLGAFVVPHIFSETRQLATDFIVQEEERQNLETEVARSYQEETGALPPEVEKPQGTLINRETQKIVDSLIQVLVGRQAFETFRESESYANLVVRIEVGVSDFIPRVIGGVREFANNFVSVSLQFLLSIIFSFIILWDLPRVREGTASFARGATTQIYEEVAPGIRALGTMLGRAFEAQSVIAISNVVLTCIGFVVLGIPSIALLGTIVFFCSYIPIFGVILSTLPAALLAIKIGGLGKLAALGVMVLIVHAIEAYALNPLIYGHHLKMHPIAVLMILLIAEHLFGVWGMILGVPMTAFLLRYVIRGEMPDSVESEPGEETAATG